MGANQSKSDSNINSDNTLHFNKMSTTVQPIAGGGNIKNDISNLILKLNIPQGSEADSDFNLSTFLNSKLDNQPKQFSHNLSELSATSSAFISKSPSNNNVNSLRGGAISKKKKDDSSSSSSTSSSDSSLDDSSDQKSKTTSNKVNKPCSKDSSCKDRSKPNRNQQKHNNNKSKNNKVKQEPKPEPDSEESDSEESEITEDTEPDSDSGNRENLTGKLRESVDHGYMSSSAHTGGELSQSSTEIFKNNNSSSASSAASSVSNENDKVNNYSISTSDINMISDL